MARNEARLVVHKDLKHNHICDIYHNFGQIYGDKNFEKHNQFVHENGVQAFTDDEFNVWKRTNSLKLGMVLTLWENQIYCKELKILKKKKKRRRRREGGKGGKGGRRLRVIFELFVIIWLG